jgi:hypothetical protein
MANQWRISVNQRIIHLYNRFVHGGLSRRQFIDRLAELAESSAAAAAFLPVLENSYAQAAVIPANDAHLTAQRASAKATYVLIHGSWHGAWCLNAYPRISSTGSLTRNR